MSIPKSYNYASFGQRALAFIFDNILISIAISPIFMMFFLEKNITSEQITEILKTQGIQGIQDLFTSMELIILNGIAIAIIIFLWVKYSGTPVKRILKLRVVDAKTGNNLTYMQATLRYMAYFISYLPMGLGFLWIIFDKNNQSWHDKIAGTVVIKDSESPQLSTQPQPSQPIQKDDDSFVA